jgi:hypothetical protein
MRKLQFDNNYQEVEAMSTKISLKYHSDEGPAGAWFHLYRE